MSNLCSLILQVNCASTYHKDLNYDHIGKDISCNLGSLNIAKIMDAVDFGKAVYTAIRALTAMADMSDILSMPSIAAGNHSSHAIGLGQINLHSYPIWHVNVSSTIRKKASTSPISTFIPWLTTLCVPLIGWRSSAAAPSAALKTHATPVANISENIPSENGNRKPNECASCLPPPTSLFQIVPRGWRYASQ